MYGPLKLPKRVKQPIKTLVKVVRKLNICVEIGEMGNSGKHKMGSELEQYKILESTFNRPVPPSI